MRNSKLLKKKKEFAKELEKRTKQFAIRIIKLSALLPNTPESNNVRYQLTKSGTSVGANYREANRAVSLADFKHKISNCEKETSETQYWLEIIIESEMLPCQKVKAEYDECSELLAIFTTIGHSSRKKNS